MAILFKILGAKFLSNIYKIVCVYSDLLNQDLDSAFNNKYKQYPLIKINVSFITAEKKLRVSTPWSTSMNSRENGVVKSVTAFIIQKIIHAHFFLFETIEIRKSIKMLVKVTPKILSKSRSLEFCDSLQTSKINENTEEISVRKIAILTGLGLELVILD